VTAEAAFRDLIAKLQECREKAQALRMTVGDAPPAGSLLVDKLDDNVSGILGALEEALASAANAAGRPHAELPRCLAACQEQALRALSLYSASLDAPDVRGDLAAAGRKSGEWQSWSKAVRDAIEDCRGPLHEVLRAVFACWSELGEILSMTAPQAETGRDAGGSNSGAAGLDYARNLFGSVSGWYENADKKAQVLLGIDGAFLAFLSGSTFAKSDELARMIKIFGAETWILLALMCLALTASIISAIFCLWSRIYSHAQIDAFWRTFGVKPSDKNTYAPEVMWFFQFVVRLDKALFAEKMFDADRRFETRALAAQVYELSRNVLRKHQWLNWGFAFAGASLILFMAALASYLMHLR
jgi:hypothetical protein